jgi:hypothetical protein
MKARVDSTDRFKQNYGIHQLPATGQSCLVVLLHRNISIRGFWKELKSRARILIISTTLMKVVRAGEFCQNKMLIRRN